MCKIDLTQNIFVVIMLIMCCALSHAQPSLKISTTKLDTANIEAQVSEPLEIEEADNSTCPVDGNEIDPDNKATYEYNGIIYNFCDPRCINGFMENPEACIERLEE